MYNNQMPPPNQMPPQMGNGFGYAPQQFMGYPQPPYHGGQNDGGYRGRGGGMRGRAGGNYFPPGFQQHQGQHPFGGRGGQGGFRGRKKKPFHGGTLETQRQWERAHICCFYLQGQCKFSEGCRFSHEDDGKPCQFEDQCKAGHGNRVEKAPIQAEQQPQQ